MKVRIGWRRIVVGKWALFLNPYFELKWKWEFPPDWKNRGDPGPFTHYWFFGPFELAHYARELTMRDLTPDEGLAAYDKRQAARKARP